MTNTNKTEKTQSGATRRMKLGEILVKAGLIDGKTLANALDIQKTQKKKIGQILMDMGAADDKEIASALASQLKIPLLNLDKIEITKEVISLVPPEMAENYLLVPIKEVKKGLHCCNGQSFGFLCDR